MNGPSSFLADLLRTPLALFYWNWRKTKYRGGGAHGRCPCQNPSDSGVVGETGCDACVSWNAPQRFRWVCPLLVQRESGWLCGVTPQDVRPFWGRAAIILFSSLLVCYLAVCSVVLIGFRVTGIERMAWLDVAWPGRWERVAQARSDYFSAQTAQLLQANNFDGVEVALYSALDLNPHNYEALLFLAQLQQYQRAFAASDALFERLLGSFPDRELATAVAWHDALLTRSRFTELAGLSLRMATLHPEQSPAWIRSVVFALRLETDVGAVLRSHAATVAKLPPAVGVVLQAEELGRSGAVEAAAKLLIEPPGGTLPPWLVSEYIMQLLRLRERDLAAVFLRRHASMLSFFDREFARMRIDQIAGDAALLRLDFASLLQYPVSPAELDRLAAWLVIHPDESSFRRLDQVMRKDENRSAITGLELWIAAVACGAEAEADYWGKQAGAKSRDQSLSGSILSFSAAKLGDPASVYRLIATGGFSREVIFSLIQRASATVRVRSVAEKSPHWDGRQ